MTVKQTATELPSRDGRQNGAIAQVYKLDGSESEEHSHGSDGTARPQRAKWDGAKLVITTKSGSDGEPDPDLVAGQRRTHGRSHRRPRAEQD